MSLPYGNKITVTPRVLGEPDDYGDATYVDGDPVTVLGAFAPVAGTEAVDEQDQVVSQPEAYLPAGTVIDSTAKVTIDGVDYEVNGEPQAWRSPYTGSTPGIVVPLKRITG